MFAQKPVVFTVLLIGWTLLVSGQPPDSLEVTSFGGPQTVGGQLNRDRNQDGEFLKAYFDFKNNLQSSSGLSYGLDYFIMVQGATETREDSLDGFAAGGVFRFYGNWDLVGKKSGNKGSLVFKVENRHRLGTEIPPQGLANNIGYSGLTAITFSDAQWILSNLFWSQQFFDSKLAFLVGLLDPADFTNVYGLVDPWNDVSMLQFSTGSTIPLPDQGFGVAIRGLIGKHAYILAGISDINADPSKPGETFKSFFQTSEYFTQLEIGWISSLDQRYARNIHLNAWISSERTEAQIPAGWGLAFSASEIFNRWNPFLRAAYTQDSGSFLTGSFALGTGYKTKRNDQLGVALGWGTPQEDSEVGSLRDQYALELYYRFQVARIFTFTPDIQLLIQPAFNPSKNVVAVFGVRSRVNL